MTRRLANRFRQATGQAEPASGRLLYLRAILGQAYALARAALPLLPATILRFFSWPWIRRIGSHAMPVWRHGIIDLRSGGYTRASMHRGLYRRFFGSVANSLFGFIFDLMIEIPYF